MMISSANKILAIALSLLLILAPIAAVPIAFSETAIAGNTSNPDWPEFGDDNSNDGNNSESTGPSEIAGLAWRNQTGQSNIYSSPVVVDGVVFIGLEDGLHAYYVSNGTEKWFANIDLKNDHDGDFDRVDSPAYYNGYLFVGTAAESSSSVKKINASTGSVVNSFDDPSNDLMGGATTVNNGSVYAVDYGGTIWKINSSTMNKEFSNGTNIDALESEPAIANGHVFLGDGGTDSKLFKLNADDLTKDWSTSVSGNIVSGPTIVNGTVYFGTDSGNLYARDAGSDPNSGDRVWNVTSKFSDDIRSAPAVANGKLFVGSWDNTLRAFDVSDGSELWSYDAGESITASPAYVDDTVYVGDHGGDFFALNASTGRLQWEFPVYNSPTKIKTSPAVVNGSVYFGDYSGDVYRLETPKSGLPVSENFNTGSVSSDWVTGGDATWGATVDGSDSLRLTEDSDYQAGFAYYDRPFSSTSGAVVEFDFYADGTDDTPADGISFFLTNGSLTHRTNIGVSSEGGSGLGYAQVENGSDNNIIDKSEEEGVPNGYIGVGFDEWGQYSANTECHDGGETASDGDATDKEPDNVVIRGVGDLGSCGDGYPYLTGTDVSSFGGIDGGWRRARITVEPIDLAGDSSPEATRIRVEMSWDDGQTWETVINDYKYTEVPPENLKLGFAGATGLSTNIHAIDNLSVRKPSDLNLTVTDASSGGNAGDSIEFTYEVTNTGPNANDQITVTDDVTTGANGLENYDWSYTTDGASASDSGSGTTVNLSLNDGETATVTVTADINSSVSNDIEHNLTADEGADFYDPSPGDLSDSHTVPLSPTADAGSYGTITEGDAVTLNASASSGAAYYEWDLDGDGDFERNETAAKVPHVFGTPGTFTITVRAVTASGGSATDTASITVDPSDDWAHIGASVARTGNNSDTASPTDLDKLWQFGDRKSGVFRGPVVVADGTTYLVHRDTLHAFDAGNGSEKWSKDVDVYLHDYDMSVAGSTLYIGAQRQILALNTTDGSEEWTYNTRRRSSLAVTDGTVYFRDDDTVGALNASDKTVQWTKSLSRGRPKGLTVGDGKVFIPADDLTVLNRSDGSTVWTSDVTLLEAPILDSGTLYGSPRGMGDTELVAIDARTGAVLWESNRGGRNGQMAVANGRLYLMDSYSIQAYNATNGSLVWDNPFLNPFNQAGGIAVGDDAVYATARAGARSGVFHYKDFVVLDPADGSILGGLNRSSSLYRGRAQFKTPPVVSNGTVYVGGNKGFFALSGNLQPTADAGTDKTVEENATVNFDGTGSSDDGSIAAYDWDFGDGTTATGAQPSHTFESAGTYTVTLTVTDDEGETATDQLTVTVIGNTVLVAEIRNNTQIVDEDSTVAFTSDSYGDEGIASTEWDFDSDGTFDATGTNVTHTYSDPGDYTVRVRVTDNAGNIATDTANVSVRDVTDPTAAITDSSKTVDEDTPVSFNGTGSTDNDEIQTYAWDFNGDGEFDATGQRPQHVFADPGTYTTNLTVTDGDGNQDSAEITVTVNDTTPPTADITTDDITAPTDVDITFNGSTSTDNGNISSYSWTFGDGSPSGSGETVTHSYTSDGTYTVTLTVTDDAGNADNDTVEVNVTGDTALVADAGSNRTINRDRPLSESNVSVTFNASGSEASEGILSYEWDFDGDGQIDDTGEEVTHTFSPGTDANNYPNTSIVRLNLTDSQGITVSDTVNVTFTATDKTPPVARSDINRTQVETGQLTRFSGTNSTDNVGVTSYEWDFNNSGSTDSSDENTTHTFTSPGEKEVILTVKDDAGNTDRVIDQILVEDFTAPTANLTANRTAISIGDAVSFDGTNSTDDDGIQSYSWKFGDNITAAGSSAVHSYATPGTYEAKLTVTDNSGNSNSTTVQVTVTDATAPTFDSASKINASAIKVVIGDNIEINKSSIASGDFELNGSATLASISTTDNGTDADVTLRFDPVEQSTVQVNITGAINDTSGNMLNSGSETVAGMDGVAPSISSFSVSNPTSQHVMVTFDSDEQLATIEVEITGAVSKTLTEGDFNQKSNTYTSTFVGGSDGTYQATLNSAEDDAGNDGAGGESDTVTIDTTPPSISSFGVSNPSNQDVTVTFESTEPLSTIRVSISGAESRTLTESDFSETAHGDGTYSYEATYRGSSDGDYTATLDTAEDDAGNDGAGGESDTVTIDTTPPSISNFTLSNDGFDLEITFDSDQHVSVIDVTISGAESAMLTEANFTEETADDGTYTYSSTYTGEAEGTYEATLNTAADGAGNDGGNGQTDDVTVEAGGPPAPKNPSATAISGGDINVSFDDVDQGTVTYSIYRNNTSTPGGFVNVTTVSDDNSSRYTYTDSGLTDGTTYEYRIAAIDAGGIEGANSTTVSATVDATAPSISNFSVTNPSGKTVEVSFESDENLTTIDVDLDLDGADEATLTAGDFTNFSGTYTTTYSGSSDGEYTATLDTAEDASGNDGASGESDSVTIDTKGPSAPGNPSATAITGGGINVSFDDVNEGAVRYTIYRNETSNGDGYVNVTTVTDDNSSRYTYTDSGVIDGTTYEYKIVATDDSGNEGPNSTTVSATADATAPSISNFTMTNPSGQDVNVTFNATEQLATIEVDITGAESANLTGSDFSEMANGDGTYTYTATHSGSSDGTYTGSLEVAQDVAGNDGASGESDSVTVNTTGPTLSSVSLGNDGSGNLTFSFDTDQQLGSSASAIEVTIDGPTSGTDWVTFDRTDFTESANSDGTFTYTLATTQPYDDGDGTYTASVDDAIDADGNDGASGESDTYTLDTTAPTIKDFTVTNPSGQDIQVEIETDEQLGGSDGAIIVSISGAETAMLTGNDFTETGTGPYRYTATYSGSNDGEYTATLDTAQDAAGNDGASGESDSVTVSTSGPSPPGNPSATAISDGQINVSFDDVDEGTVRYTIYRNDTSTSADFAHVTTVSDDNSSRYTYTDTDTIEGTTYEYKIAATDEAGTEGPNSSTVSATPGAIAPTIGGFQATNPSGQDLVITIESSDQLANIQVDLTGRESVTLDADDFTEVANDDGTYTYTATYAASRDGQYTATLTEAADAEANDGASGQEDSTTVDTTPPVADPGDDRTVNEDTTIAFDGTASTDNIGITNYRWTFGDGTTASGPTPSHSYSEPGTYTVTLIVEDGSGLIDSSTIEITVTDVTAPEVDTGDNRTVDTGTALGFDASDSTDNVGIASYEWAFGDGTMATGVTPTHVYDDPGTYTVTVTVTDRAGNSATETVTVTVLDGTPPNAVAESRLQPAEDTTVEFDASNSTDNVGIANYEWEFDDGTTATGVTTTHTFEDSGRYTVTLRVTDTAGNIGTDRVTIRVQESSTLIADAGSNKTIEEDTTVTLSAGQSQSNEGIASYEWEFGDGTTATGRTVDRSYADPGTYLVTLTVTDTEGNVDTDMVAVTVTDTTPPVADAGGDRTVEEDSLVTFDGRNSTDNAGIAAYSWSFGDQTSGTGSTPETMYEEPGEYTLTLEVVDAAGHTDTDTATVTVQDITPPTPNMGAEIENDTIRTLENTTIGFNANGSRDNVGIANYTWTFTNTSPTSVDSSTSPSTSSSADDRSVSGTASSVLKTVHGISASHTYIEDGTYGVTLNVTDTSGNVGSKQITVLVVEPSVLIVDAGTDQTVPEDTRVDFTAGQSRSNEGIAAYEWTFGDGSNATGITPSHVYPEPGTYTVTLTLTDQAGNVASDSITVRVTDVTPPVSEAGVNRTVDANTSMTFDASGSTDNVGIVEYRWDFGDGTHATGPRPTHTYRQPGRYTVTLRTVDAAGNVDKDTVTVTVEASKETPTPSPPPEEPPPSTSTPTPTPTPTATASPVPTPSPTATATTTERPTASPPGTTATVTPSPTPPAEEAPSIGVVPISLIFEEVSAGESKTLAIEVKNLVKSQQNLTVSTTQIVGRDPGAFAVVGGGAPFTLSPGETQKIEVRFSPTTAGTRQAQLQILSNAGRSQIDVWLSNSRAYIVVQSVGVDAERNDRTVNIDAVNIPKNSQLEINVSRPTLRNAPASVDTVRMTVDRAGNFSMNLTHSSEPEGEDAVAYSEEGRSVIQYLRVDYNVPASAFENTSFVFRVKRSALPAGAAPANITILRRANGAWNEQGAELVRSGGGTLYYRVATEGFSQFVVSAPTSGAIASPPDEGGDGIWLAVLLGVLGLLALALLFLLRRRRGALEITVRNPMDRDLLITVQSELALSELEVRVRATTGDRSEVVRYATAAFEAVDSEGVDKSHVYQVRGMVDAEASYVVELTRAVTEDGNDIAAGQADTVTVQTNA